MAMFITKVSLCLLCVESKKGLKMIMMEAFDKKEMMRINISFVFQCLECHTRST